MKEMNQAINLLWLQTRAHMTGVVNPWRRLARAVVELPSLEGFRRHADVALGNKV